MPRWSKLATLAVVALCSPHASALDRVVLKEGAPVEGRVVFEDGERVVVRIGSKDREIARNDVAEIHSRARDAREVALSWEKLAPADVKGRLELAQFAREHDLEGEAHFLAWSVLAKEPENEVAHTLLGHERKQGAWSVKVDLRWVPYERWLELRREFKNTEPMPTAHFRLRTNVPLEAACSFALELELYYVTLMEWMRAELDLYEVLEPITLQVHADNKSYPGGSGRKGYFDPESNTVFADVSEGYALQILIHETTHALLNATAARTKEAVGNIPSWVNEGLADYMSFSRDGALGHPRYRQAANARFYFAIHVDARKPLSLARVLALTPADYNMGPNIGLAYAQSFTLVHFCLHAGENAYRPKFFEFLRQCYRGRSSSTDFKTAMGLDAKPLEAAWLEWARKNK